MYRLQTPNRPLSRTHAPPFAHAHCERGLPFNPVTQQKCGTVRESLPPDLCWNVLLRGVMLGPGGGVRVWCARTCFCQKWVPSAGLRRQRKHDHASNETVPMFLFDRLDYTFTTVVILVVDQKCVRVH